MEGQYDQAYDYYQKALHYDSTDGHVYGSLVTIDLRRGNFDEAVRNGELAIQYEPNDPLMYANLALAYHYAGDLDKRDSTAATAEAMGYHRIDSLYAIIAGEQPLFED